MALGWPKLQRAAPPPVTATPAELCRRALNGALKDWDTRYANDVAEAKRQNLSIDDCRVAVVTAAPRGALCLRALTADKENWEGTSSINANYVVEAKRRNLSIDDCRVAIGLPKLERAVAPDARAALCRRALNAAREDWENAQDTRSIYANDVAEAKRRNLSIDDCRVAIGLPKLERAATPPVTAQPIPAPGEPPLPAPGGGAKIDVQTVTQDGQELTFISIEGELVLGDEKRFGNAAMGFSSAIVMLSSPGGNLFSGIEIGRDIRLKGFATLVPEGFQCASACALAWLGGSPRFMGAGSTVGFHAASSTEFGGPSSMGNAAIGAYLNQLNLPLKAILYFTEPQPDQIRWLTFDDAEKYGIEVRRFPSG